MEGSLNFWMLAKFYGNVRFQRRITIPSITKRHDIFYEIGIRHASKQPLPASLLIKFFRQHRHIAALLLNPVQCTKYVVVL